MAKGKSWKCQLKHAPIGDGAMVLIPEEVLGLLGWSVGSYIRLEPEDGFIRVIRYHRREGELG